MDYNSDNYLPFAVEAQIAINDILRQEAAAITQAYGVMLFSEGRTQNPAELPLEDQMLLNFALFNIYAAN